MIDEEKTFRDKGYYSTELSFGSCKKVWAICEGENCKRVGGRGRWVMIKAYSALCHRCANKLQRIYDYDEDVVRSIDEEKTFVEKGYRSTDLSAQSGKKVYAICIVCGIGRWVEFGRYYDMCHWCAMRSDEHRAVVSKAQTGLPTSVEARANLSAAMQGISYDEWEGFAKDKPYCPAFDEKCRESNRDKYDRKCFLCGLPESENITSTDKLYKLSVHHVNMNKDQGCDNHEWKLVPLCIHHHRSAHSDSVMNRIIYLLNNVWNKE